MSNGKFASTKIGFPLKKSNSIGNKLLPWGKKNALLLKNDYSMVWKVREALTRARAVMDDIGMSLGAKAGLKETRRTFSGSSAFWMYFTAV